MKSVTCPKLDKKWFAYFSLLSVSVDYRLRDFKRGKLTRCYKKDGSATLGIVLVLRCFWEWAGIVIMTSLDGGLPKITTIIDHAN